MASFKALCLAGVASLAATAANAADLLPPPPPAPYYAPAPAPAIGGGWYLRGDVGVGINDIKQKGSTFGSNVSIPGLRYDQSFLDDSSFIDGGVGYRINEYLRADITGEYRGAAHYSATESYKCTGGFCQVPRGYDYYSGSVSSVVGLVNGYVDVGTWYGVTPFFGGGVGIAHVGFHNVTDQGAEAAAGGFGLASTRYTTNFAFALMAGLDFAITQNLKMEIGYRYLDQGNISSGTIACQSPGVCPNEVQRYRLTSNDIRLGFRYTFADLAPPAFFPQGGPLIRKY